MMNKPEMTHRDIINFWFSEIDPASWWRKDEQFDRMLTERFGGLHARAMAGELFEWRRTPAGRLAEIIVLDQFSRNMFRDTPRAFASDGMALVLAQEAVQQQADKDLTAQECIFLYMPYMHSESLLIHEQAVALYTANGITENLDFEIRHQQIIARFGRYPHRNAILGRESTAEELAFLQEPGSSF